MNHRPRSSASVSIFFATTVALSFGVTRQAHGHGRGGFFPGKRSPADTAAQCGAITYCGGPVISSVQIVPVYWTDQVASATTAWAPTYSQSIADSELLDMLSEYSTAGKTGEACGMQTDAGLQYFGPATPATTGQTITRGTALPAVTITPTTATGSNLTDDNATIGAELVGQIGAGVLPKPTYDAQGYPNTLYVVYFPSSVGITLQGMQSCQAFGGYHYSAPYTAQASCKGQYIAYAVIPDCGSEGDQLSDTVSHELAEAVTDVDVGPTTPSTASYGDGAWYLGPSYPCNSPSNCPQDCGEVGDVCQSSGDATIPGTSVVSQDIWSQAQNGCAVNNPATGTQAPPGGAPVTTCPASSSSSSGGSGSGSGSGGSSGSSSGGGSGGGSGGSSGSGSGGDGGSGSSGGGSSSGGSSGGLTDAGPTGSPDAASPGADDGGGNAATPSGSSSGCGCSLPGTGASGETAGVLAVLGFALVGRLQRRRARRDA